ncbi:MAG TPA: CapA family protein [Gammaproteobacteria bacterium]|nr:CapA family protein [Gammaproteobacteria bacterium]
MVMRKFGPIPLYLISLLMASCSTVSPKSGTIDKGVVRQPAPADTVTLVAVGDMMFGGSSESIMEQQGYDYPFATTRHILTAADLTIGNLETPLTAQGAPMTEKQFLFRNPPEKVGPALRRAGFDIVSLANNHMLDYGTQGLQDTIQALQSYGIRPHGAGMNLAAARQPVIFELPQGLKAGFLSYSCTFPEEFWATEDKAGTAFCHEKNVRADVARLTEQAVDIIVVSFHWGAERMKELRPYQPLLAHAAIDAGADLVIGHHPHILQGIEQYRDGLILYSLGNFTFGSRTQHARTSVVASIAFNGGKFSRLEMTPINVNNFEVDFQPRPLLHESAEAVYDELAELSPLTRLDFRNGLIVFEPISSVQTETPVSH